MFFFPCNNCGRQLKQIQFLFCLKEMEIRGNSFSVVSQQTHFSIFWLGFVIILHSGTYRAYSNMSGIFKQSCLPVNVILELYHFIQYVITCKRSFYSVIKKITSRFTELRMRNMFIIVWQSLIARIRWPLSLTTLRSLPPLTL